MKGGHMDVRRFFQICIADTLEQMSAEELEVVYDKTFESSPIELRNVKIESALPFDEVGIPTAINKILMEACDYDHLYRSS